MKQINRSLLSLTLATVLSATAAGTALAEPPAKAAPPSFKNYDSDADGRVSRGEFIAQGGDQQAFREGDADGDNFLNKDEFIKASANNERIKVGKFVDDALITAKVKALLLKDESVKGLDVNVETHKGTVQLSGWVSNPAQIPKAEKIAYGVEGVKAVRNDLQIKR